MNIQNPIVNVGATGWGIYGKRQEDCTVNGDPEGNNPKKQRRQLSFAEEKELFCRQIDKATSREAEAEFLRVYTSKYHAIGDQSYSTSINSHQ